MNKKTFLATHKIISKVIFNTPLIYDEYISKKMSANIFYKAESLQRTGSFKIRGAYNFLYNLSEKYKKNGVLAWSSGNHAQGVAEASRLFNVESTIVMPKDAPKNKIKGTLDRGAKVIFYDRKKENREEIGANIAVEKKYKIIPPYDNPLIIYGQGTIGIEIETQLNTYKLTPDNILVPTGGGGLIAGIASYIKNKYNNAKIYSVEPNGFSDHLNSLKEGKRIKNKNSKNSICDALLANQPGKITFDINKKLLHKGLVVEDNSVLKAMHYALTNLGLVLEPGGAIALAALLEKKIPVKGKTIIVILTGSNVEKKLLQKVFSI